jgi:hypothetical protein
MVLDEHGDFLLDEHGDVNGLGYRDVNWVWLRDVNVTRDKVWYLHWYLYGIWDFLYDCDGNFLFNHDWVWFGDVHRDWDFLFDVDRDVNFDRDWDFFFYSVRNWVRDRYFYFLGDRDGRYFFFFVVSIAALEGVPFPKAAQTEMTISSERMP